MVGLKSAFTSISVRDADGAKSFYTEKLNLPLVMEMGSSFFVDCGGGTHCMIYPKDDHVPAEHTVLNFMVEDLEKAVDDLVARGVPMTPPEGMETNAKGIAAGGPAPVAWFKDPDGNWLAVGQVIDALQ